MGLAVLLHPLDSQTGLLQRRSQTVSASGICRRSASSSGLPSSRVNAKRPPNGRADAIPCNSGSLSSNASIVSSSMTTSNGPSGTGGTRLTSKRQGRPAARSRAISIALALESTPR
jgi:hypothetical protein